MENHETLVNIKNIEILCENGFLLIGKFYLMDSSVFIWLGTENIQAMGNLVSSINTKYDSMPLSSLLIGDGSEMTDNANSLSTRLSKKLNKQVFLSYNLGSEFNDHLVEIELKLLSKLIN